MKIGKHAQPAQVRQLGAPSDRRAPAQGASEAEPEPESYSYGSTSPPGYHPDAHARTSSTGTDELDPTQVQVPVQGQAAHRQPPPAEASASAKPRSKDSDALLLGVGCVITLVAVVVIAAVFALQTINHRGQAAPAAPAATSASTATGVAIAVASPTAGPTPVPTPTQIPTIKPTPLPTWTPLPGSAAAAKALDYRGKDSQYRQDMTRIGDFVTSSLTEVNTLMQNPKPTDDHWAYQMATQVQPWKDFFATVQQVEPPTQYQQANDNLVKALQRLDSAADDMLYAIQYGDKSQFQSAQDKIAQGSDLLKQAMSALKSTADGPAGVG